MADWRFEFVDSTSQGLSGEETLSSAIPDSLGSGTSERSIVRPTLGNKKNFASEFEGKLEKDVVSRYIVSPLNTVTGGLASPLYMSGKKLASGATLGAVTGDLVATGVILAVSYGISALQNRMKELETKVNELNNTDNALIRAGSVSKTTYYSANIFGIKKSTNRS